MGAIEPLDDLDHRLVELDRIYKFSAKFFLTMGMYHHLPLTHCTDLRPKYFFTIYHILFKAKKRFPRSYCISRWKPGLQKTNINHITTIDKLYSSRLKARQDIIEQYPGALACVDNAVEMLNEFYVFLVERYLPGRYPSVFQVESSPSLPKSMEVERLAGEGGPNNDDECVFLKNQVTGDLLPLQPPKDRYETLRLINRNLDEDFLMMLPTPSPSSLSSSAVTTTSLDHESKSKTTSGSSNSSNASEITNEYDIQQYTLQAFIWAYPVGFDPQSKLNLSLREAHAPVPGYNIILAKSMDRYFAQLEPGNVRFRYNWALATSGDLCVRGEYHLYDDDDKDQKKGSSVEGGGDNDEKEASRAVGEEIAEKEEDEGDGENIDISECYVRCERQTVFALPKSGGKILSVHLYLYPLREIKEKGLGPDLLQAADGWKKGNAPGFWRYKRSVHLSCENSRGLFAVKGKL